MQYTTGKNNRVDYIITVNHKDYEDVFNQCGKEPVKDLIGFFNIQIWNFIQELPNDKVGYFLAAGMGEMYLKKGERSAWFENGFAGIEIQIFFSGLIFCNDFQ